MIKINKAGFIETGMGLFMGLKKVLLDPSVQRTIKRQQGSKELSRIIGDQDDYNPETQTF